MKTIPAIRVHWRRSRWRAAVASAVAVTTVLLLATLDMPWWLTLAGVTWCAVAWAFDRRRARGQAPASVIVGADRQITLAGARGAVQSGTVLDGTYVTGFLTTIVWRPAGAWCPRCIVVLPDNMAAEDRRRLRVWLRLGHAADAAAATDIGAPQAPPHAP